MSSIDLKYNKKNWKSETNNGGYMIGLKRHKIKKIQDDLFKSVVSRFEDEYKKEAGEDGIVHIMPIALHISVSQINFIKHFLNNINDENAKGEDGMHVLVSSIVNEYIVNIIYDLIYSSSTPDEKQLNALSTFLDGTMKEIKQEKV